MVQLNVKSKSTPTIWAKIGIWGYKNRLRFFEYGTNLGGFFKLSKYL